MKRLDGKIALITGCNRGIGRAIMDAFVQEGASVVACTRKQSEEQNRYYDECVRKFGIKIFPLYFDLAEENSIKGGIKQLYSLKTNIDILVNNAGMLNTDGLLRLNMQKAREVMQVNYFAPLLITQSVFKLMLRSKNASVINISSYAGINPEVGNSVYGASKAALNNATRCWAKEMGPAKIRVNAIAPNMIETDMNNVILEDVAKNIIGKSIMKRMGRVNEIANTVIFLASEESSFITGQIIQVDGGI